MRLKERETTLRGLLRLAEEMLWIEADRKTVILRIEEATFHISEIRGGRSRWMAADWLNKMQDLIGRKSRICGC